MAAIAFDPMEYSPALEAAGVPSDRVEVHAKAMTANFVHNMDALVTKDYLDVRLAELQTRMDAGMDRGFAETGSRFGRRFAEISSRFDHRFAEVDVKLARINILLGVLLAAVSVPVLQTLMMWME